MPNKKPLWEQWGFESFEQLCEFHEWAMERRRAARSLPTGEGAEHHHAERSSKKEEGATGLEPKKEEGAAELEPKKEEGAAEPKKARKFNDHDSNKSAESGRNEETSKRRCRGLDAADNMNTDSTTTE
ncbi:unnamed protein product [Clonostachys solani]|uniref:Uncharacterized protein n=1 Tax=Clonostachys solani TaxID=160281 RepID=A0A9P0EE94_9HYPO|nr:unnamed protein product [Clonostachys solani]